MSATPRRTFIQSNGSPGLPGRTHFVNPVGSDGILRCYHGQVLDILTSKTIDNPGRKFYTCFKGKGDPGNCGFFKWEDDIFQREQETMNNLSGPNTKRFRSTQETPPSLNILGKQSRKPEDSNGNQESVGGFGLDVNDNGDEISIGDEPPQKKSRIGTYCQTDIESRDEASKLAVPPIFRTMQSLGSNPRPSKWEAIRDDPENPFHDRASALRQTQATPSTCGSPTKRESLTEPLTKIIEELTDLNSQVQRLERQRIAIEKSRDAKSQRIAQLEKQVELLSNRNRSLEEELEDLRAR